MDGLTTVPSHANSNFMENVSQVGFGCEYVFYNFVVANNTLTPYRLLGLRNYKGLLKFLYFPHLGIQPQSTLIKNTLKFETNYTTHDIYENM
jgi:hypothetical protein